MRTVLVIAMITVCVCSTAFAQSNVQQQAGITDQKRTYLYQWTDSKGGAHVTDDLSKVPMKYRDKATVVEQQQEEEPSPTQQRTIGPAPSDDERIIEADRKAEWQDRMKDARKRLADAEQRYRSLDQKRTKALEKWGGVASGHLEGRVEADRIEQEMKQVRQEIDDARNQVQNVLPEEARKAGVPPGWLRE
jgi:hypothetical protein